MHFIFPIIKEKTYKIDKQTKQQIYKKDKTVSSLPSSIQYLSNDCLEDKREDYQNRSVLYHVLQLCTMICTHTHIWAVLTVDCWFGLQAWWPWGFFVTWWTEPTKTKTCPRHPDVGALTPGIPSRIRVTMSPVWLCDLWPCQGLSLGPVAEGLLVIYMAIKRFTAIMLFKDPHFWWMKINKTSSQKPAASPGNPGAPIQRNRVGLTSQNQNWGNFNPRSPDEEKWIPKWDSWNELKGKELLLGLHLGQNEKLSWDLLHLRQKELSRGVTVVNLKGVTSSF